MGTEEAWEEEEEEEAGPYEDGSGRDGMATGLGQPSHDNSCQVECSAAQLLEASRAMQETLRIAYVSQLPVTDDRPSLANARPGSTDAKGAQPAVSSGAGSGGAGSGDAAGQRASARPTEGTRRAPRDETMALVSRMCAAVRHAAPRGRGSASSASGGDARARGPCMPSADEAADSVLPEVASEAVRALVHSARELGVSSLVFAAADHPSPPSCAFDPARLVAWLDECDRVASSEAVSGGP